MSDLSTGMLRNYLAIAREAAYKGGAVLQQYWKKLESVQTKENGDLVTIADKESERLVIETITHHFPDHGIIAEESGHHCADENCVLKWAVDPLDGTTNYTHTFPEFGVSIGLLHQGNPIVGVVYLPVQDVLFEAALGKGATKNGERIRVSSVEKIEESLLISGFFRGQKNADRNVPVLKALSDKTHGIRITGAAAVNLVEVAEGAAEGFWYQGLKIWDIIAGAVIVQEAGGVVTGYDGKAPDWELGEIVASNGKVHQQLLEVLR